MSAPVYTTADIRRIEAAAGNAHPPLMERAGLAAADLAAQLASQRGKDILVLAGPGNNGGDARIAARILQERFFRVTTLTVADAARTPDATRWALVIDGLFGIGLTRDVAGDHARLVDYANAQSCPVLALDIPSGLGSDTGRVLGKSVRATHTLTFIAHKPGLLTLDGPDLCGQVRVADLGLDVRSLLPPTGWIAGPELLPHLLKPRPRNFHKGNAGSVAIVGGATGMCGAALLAGRAALRLGAGRVYVGLLDHAAPNFDAGALELMLRHPDETLGLDLDAIVIGPGLGQGERAETLLGAVLSSEIPCVLDADALNLLAQSADLKDACTRRSADTLITPHPAEAARLLGTSTLGVQNDRLSSALQLRERFNAHVVLKGNGSVLVARDSHWFINTSGNPGMASAGMGDVLSGMLGTLLGQGFSGEAALVLGTHLHGAAADACAAGGCGPVGLTASEVADAARRVWNQWLEKPGTDHVFAR
ncbi:MAG: NAD(P)H-hydrate dehydratase [Betaproteobacteria bacterium]|nr:NAD(P)H-hydrate dehydratase [Betaproteobacteria bacterium]